MGLILAPSEIKTNMATLRSYLGSMSECYENVQEKISEYCNDDELDTEAWVESKNKMEICYYLIAEGMLSVQESVAGDIDTLLGCIGDEYLDEDELNAQIERLEEQCQYYEERITELNNMSSVLPSAGYVADMTSTTEIYKEAIENIKEKIAVLREKIIFLHEAEDLTVNLFQSATDLLTAVQNAISDGGVNVTTGCGFPQHPEWLTALSECQNINGMENADDFALYLIEQGFPEGYIKYLMILHEEYPEWKFEAVITEINYEEFVTFQLSIQEKCADFDNDEKYCMASDFPGEVDPTYHDANREAVNYFMNPYSMLQLGNKGYTNAMQFFKADQELSEDCIEYMVRKILQGEDEDTINAIINAESCINPVFMAALYAGENGPNKEYYKDEDVYNLFNIGAYSGRDGAREFAYNQGWFSLEKCIEGSEEIFQEYIDRGQDTLYALDWDFISYENGEELKQYAALVNDAEDKAIMMCKKYGKSFDLHYEFTFKIPVYVNVTTSGEGEYGALPDPKHT